jgi:hypothetical protein
VELEGLKRETLKQLGLPIVEYAEDTVKIVVTAEFLRELSEGSQVSLARELARRIHRDLGDREPVGIVSGSTELIFSDTATGCEEFKVKGIQPEGCYRIVLKVATAGEPN